MNPDAIRADRSAFPGRDWSEWPVGASGWSGEGLCLVATLLAAGGSTALMVIDGGKLIFQWGDVTRRSSVASVRKSLISLLYGIAIVEGRIDLHLTLADLEIDDIEPLTPQERRATVADLLGSRSGVYLPAVYQRSDRPARGSHAPGGHWFYNNWDFNVLGTIYERVTGQSVFAAFAERIAIPLGMQDFTVDDCRHEHGAETRHPVYKMKLSARDLSRVGLMVLRDGQWGDARVVPPEWLDISTQPHSNLGGGQGYGYLWWTATADAAGDALKSPVRLFYASGLGGQYVIVIPGLDLVVVHRAARVDLGISHDRMGDILKLVLAAMPSPSA